MYRTSGAKRRYVGGAGGADEVIGNNSGNTDNGDFLYYNAIIYGNSSNRFTVQPASAFFSEVRSLPLLTETAGWNMAVARLTTQGATEKLPILIPTLSGGSDSETIYNVGIKVDFSVYSAGQSPSAGSLVNMPTNTSSSKYYDTNYTVAGLPLIGSNPGYGVGYGYLDASTVTFNDVFQSYPDNPTGSIVLNIPAGFYSGLGAIASAINSALLALNTSGFVFPPNTNTGTGSGGQFTGFSYVVASGPGPSDANAILGFALKYTNDNGTGLANGTYFRGNAPFDTFPGNANPNNDVTITFTGGFASIFPTLPALHVYKTQPGVGQSTGGLGQAIIGFSNGPTPGSIFTYDPYPNANPFGPNNPNNSLALLSTNIGQTYTSASITGYITQVPISTYGNITIKPGGGGNLVTFFYCYLAGTVAVGDTLTPTSANGTGNPVAITAISPNPNPNFPGVYQVTFASQVNLINGVFAVTGTQSRSYVLYVNQYLYGGLVAGAQITNIAGNAVTGTNYTLGATQQGDGGWPLVTTASTATAGSVSAPVAMTISPPTGKSTFVGATTYNYFQVPLDYAPNTSATISWGYSAASIGPIGGYVFALSRQVIASDASVTYAPISYVSAKYNSNYSTGISPDYTSNLFVDSQARFFPGERVYMTVTPILPASTSNQFLTGPWNIVLTSFKYQNGTGFSYSATASAPIIFTPQHSAQPRWCTSYDWWARCVNNALQEAANNLESQLALSPYAGLTGGGGKGVGALSFVTSGTVIAGVPVAYTSSSGTLNVGSVMTSGTNFNGAIITAITSTSVTLNRTLTVDTNPYGFNAQNIVEGSTTLPATTYTYGIAYLLPNAVTGQIAPSTTLGGPTLSGSNGGIVTVAFTPPNTVTFTGTVGTSFTTTASVYTFTGIAAEASLDAYLRYDPPIISYDSPSGLFAINVNPLAIIGKSSVASQGSATAAAGLAGTTYISNQLAYKYRLYNGAMLDTSAAVGVGPLVFPGVGTSYIETWTIYFNEPLQNLMPFPIYKSLDADSSASDAFSNELTFHSSKLIAYDDPFTAESNSAGKEYVFSLSQEYVSTAAWSPYIGLAITTNSIPAQFETSGFTIVSSGQAPLPQIGNVTNPILFDLDFSLTNAHSVLQGITYSPTIYRWVSMAGGPLADIGFFVYLKKRDNTFEPWNLPADAMIDMKFLFSRRAGSQLT
jgi:hypothetical protein